MPSAAGMSHKAPPDGTWTDLDKDLSAKFGTKLLGTSGVGYPGARRQATLRLAVALTALPFLPGPSGPAIIVCYNSKDTQRDTLVVC